MRKLTYGPLTATVRRLKPSGEDEVFRVTLEDREGRRFRNDTHVPWEAGDEPILDRVAVWRAIDLLRFAAREPDQFEATAWEGKAWTGRVLKAASAFGEQALNDAWGDTLVEAERLQKRPWERGGPKEWFPGS